MPGKRIEGTCHIVEFIIIQRVVRFDRSFGKAIENPLVGLRKGQLGKIDIIRIKILEIHQRKTAGVPELVDKIPITADPLGGELDVTPHRRECAQGEAKGIGTILINDGQWVDDIPLAFAHLLPLSIAHQSMDINLLEGNFIHALEAHHHHPGDPEEKDVEPGYQTTGRVELLQGFGLFRPAQG